MREQEGDEARHVGPFAGREEAEEHAATSTKSPEPSCDARPAARKRGRVYPDAEMTPGFSHTTEPIPPRGRWRERYERIWQGIEPPREVTPGTHSFDGKNHRRRAELYHNAALQAGYDSELASVRLQFSHVYVTERGSTPHQPA